jgi:hypothetical protein
MRVHEIFSVTPSNQKPASAGFLWVYKQVQDGLRKATPINFIALFVGYRCAQPCLQNPYSCALPLLTKPFRVIEPLVEVRRKSLHIRKQLMLAIRQRIGLSCTA